MKAQEYLENKLQNCAHYLLADREEEALRRLGRKDFLFDQITRKKFRKWKLPDQARDRIERALSYSLPKEEPLTFRFRFGGYKLWRLISAPEVDWAEFFSLAHYREYLAPIVSAYKPGVKLLFMSDDVFVERLDNIPKSDTEAYYQSFQKLLSRFQTYFPKNLSIEVIRHSSLYGSPEDLEVEFEEKLGVAEEAFNKKHGGEELNVALATSALNIKWEGVKDLTGLSEVEKQEKIKRGVLMHDALMLLPTLRAFLDQPQMIPIFSQPFPTVVAIGTTKTSIVRFWVGTGILEKRGEAFYDRVLSPKQVEKLKNAPYQEKIVDLIPLRNFSSIKIYDQVFDFVR